MNDILNDLKILIDNGMRSTHYAYFTAHILYYDEVVDLDKLIPPDSSCNVRMAICAKIRADEDLFVKSSIRKGRGIKARVMLSEKGEDVFYNLGLTKTQSHNFYFISKKYGLTSVTSIYILWYLYTADSPVFIDVAHCEVIKKYGVAVDHIAIKKLAGIIKSPKKTPKDLLKLTTEKYNPRFTKITLGEAGRRYIEELMAGTALTTPLIDPQRMEAVAA